MKFKLLTLMVVLSGCTTGYLYDDGHMAPVRNYNTYPHRPNPNYRQPVDLQQNSYAQELERQKAQAQREAQARAEEARRAAQNSVSTTTNSDDGWEVKPQEPKTNKPAPSSNKETVKKETPPTASDEPKFERVKNTAQNTQQKATEKVEKVEKTVSETKAKVEKKVEETKSSAPTREIAREEPKPQNSSNVDALLNKANAELQKNNLDGAVAYLKDASRLRKDPKIHYDIANIRYAQGRYREAESAASQAIRMGGADKNTQKKIWTVIANSRDKSGDKSGAKAAADKAANL